MTKGKKCALGLAVGLLLALIIGIAALNRTLPDTFRVEPGQALTLAGQPWLKEMRPLVQTVQADSDTSRNATLALFGVVPVKTVRVVEHPQRQVWVCGVPFGVKMFASGTLVVGFSDLSTVSGSHNPAKEAGLCIGDVILSVDGSPVHSNQDISAALGRAEGRALTIRYRRDGAETETTLVPVLDNTTNTWRAGMWVRDSSAGIGTLTFYDPDSGGFGGLGHAISDGDTGQSLTLLSGEVAKVEITGYEKGSPGTPGQLKGQFNSVDWGQIYANADTGVYGHLDSPTEENPWPVANSQEVEPGTAQMITTIEGRTPQTYTIKIERVSLSEADPNRNMIIRITDPRLLEATGGIIQGMSGSPILQNGKLVGAVTHVLINDPTRGYAIFAQTMLEEEDAAFANHEMEENTVGDRETGEESAA